MGCEAAAAGAANLMLSVGFHVLSWFRLVPGEVWRAEGAGADFFTGLGAAEPAGTKRLDLAAKRVEVEKWAIGAFAARCAARESIVSRGYARICEVSLVVERIRAACATRRVLLFGKVRLGRYKIMLELTRQKWKERESLESSTCRHLASTDDGIRHQGQVS
jgi:hypothetical protein